MFLEEEGEERKKEEKKNLRGWRKRVLAGFCLGGKIENFMWVKYLGLMIFIGKLSFWV